MHKQTMEIIRKLNNVETEFKYKRQRSKITSTTKLNTLVDFNEI